MRRYKVAVVGATGAVRGEILNILAARRFPAFEVVALALASARSVNSATLHHNIDPQLSIIARQGATLPGGPFGPGAGRS